MNKIIFFILLLFSTKLIWSQSTSSEKTFSFKIDGTIRNYNGKSIYVHHKWNEKDYTDSAKIVKGKSKPAVKFDPKKFNIGLTPQERAIKASVDKEARSEELRRWTSSAEYQNAVKAEKAARDKAILAERKANIKKSDNAKLNQWSTDIVDPSNWTRQNVADAAAGLGDKARLFPNDPDSFIDEWLNPGVMIGNMASDLGSAPLRAQQEDSYMPYATSIGLPLLVGGLEGIGANTTRQFVSNIANPFNIVPGYRSAENAIAKSIGKQLQRKTALPIIGNYEVPSIAQSIGKYKTYVPEAEKGLEPYISQVGESGISREEEVFRNVMGPEYRGAKELENTKFLDQQGNVIANPNAPLTDIEEEMMHLYRVEPKNWDAMDHPISADDERFIEHVGWGKPGDIDYEAPMIYPYGAYGKWFESNPERLINYPSMVAPGIMNSSDNVMYKLSLPKSEAEKYLVNDNPEFAQWSKSKNTEYVVPFDRATTPKMEFVDTPEGIQAVRNKFKFKQGGVIKSNRGQWDYPGQVTEIDQRKKGSYIDMGPDPKTGKKIDTPVLAVSDTGDVKILQPGGKYKLNGTKVTEYPIAEDGIQTTTDNTTIPDGKAFLNKLKEEAKAKKKIDIREPAPTAVNDNIQNASRMAANADAARVKDVRNSNRVAAEKAKAQAEAQKKFNALSKEEQERAMYDYYNQQQGTISEYTPDSMLSKLDQSALAPFTALKDLYQNGEVRDNLLKSIINNPETANAYDAAYLGTLGYAAAPTVGSAIAAAPAAISPYATMIGNSLATDAVIGGNTIAGLNLGNAINAGFATHGAMNIGPDIAEWAEDPSWDKAEDVFWDVAEIAPAVGPTAKTIGEGFGYVRNASNKAINAIKESVPYQATFSPKSSTANIQKRLAEIKEEYKILNNDNTAVDAYNDAKFALRDEEQRLLNLLNNRNPYESAGYHANVHMRQDKIDRANQFILNEDGLYQSVADNPLGFKQGSSEIIDLATGEKFAISVKGPQTESVQRLNDKGEVVKELTTIAEPIMNEDYVRVLNKNIAYIEKNLPGAKVYGSTRTAGELGVPHITGDLAHGDYDIYMTQSNYEKHFGKPSNADYNFAQPHVAPGEHGKDLKMEVNVIAETKAGKATGTRANELFRQWEPDEFFKAAKEAMKKGKDAKIEIPYTSEQLIDKVNPTVKTVVDAYEAWKNDKNISKIDGIINYGNPDIVIEGQEKFIKGLLGSRGNLGHQFDPSQFTDIKENVKLLKDINFIGNPERVARDPKKMQIALNDYYINNSVLARHVNGIPLDDLATYESALGTYDPNAPGARANGILQNNVTLAAPRHLEFTGDYVTGVKQYKLNLDTSNPKAYVESIKHTTSGSKLFTQEEKDILHEIVEKYRGRLQGMEYSADASNNTTALVHNLPKTEEGKALAYEFAKRTNRRLNVQEGNAYAANSGGTYVSAMDDFDEAIDVMTYTYVNHYDFDRALKSFNSRAQSAKMNSSQKINALTEELVPKEFQQIKGYLEGGITKAKDRLKEAEDLRLEYYRIKNEKTARLASKKYGKAFSEADAKYNEYFEQTRILRKQIQEMEDRLWKINSFTNDVKETAASAIIAGVVGGLGIGGASLVIDETLTQRDVNNKFTDVSNKIDQEMAKPNPDQKVIDKLNKEYEDFKQKNKSTLSRWTSPDPKVIERRKKEQEKRQEKENKRISDSIYNEEAYEMDRETDSILMSTSNFKKKYDKIESERKEAKRKADSIRKENRPFVDKAIDWFSGKNQNGGTITKAKDGSQLVKLDQLTNFTNYNKPQPGGWLEKYN